MTRTNACFRAACLAGLATITCVAAAPAAAQAQAEAAYDLPAQDLADALRAIARISGREIIFSSAAARGRTAPALRGRMTVEGALRTALRGSGLVAVERQGALVVVERAGMDAPADAGTGETGITVTGSRIRGAGSASPVIVARRERLEEAGITDLEGFARILPQNYTGGQNPGVAGGGQQGGQNNINNSTTLNLRGLGPDATLTLLNGHRLAYDALNQGIDISAIPLAAIDRVEVIADGASALYGSDAVGGVANIILRRDFDGAETGVRYGAATAGGYEQTQAWGVTGARWSSGGFMAAADFSRSGAIDAADRPYTRNIDGSQTLIASHSGASGVIAGHQRLTRGVVLELDAQASHRTAEKSNIFLATTDVFTNGSLNRPTVETYSITPTLRIALPADWSLAASYSRGVSLSDLDTLLFQNRVRLPGRVIYENRFSSFEATAEGPLFEAPGGPARLAIGAGHRSVFIDGALTRIVGGATVSLRQFTDARDVKFAYGELSLPLVGAGNRMPLAEQLRLSAALRYEDNEGMESIVTPKIGLVYQPVRDATFRATWGKSFKTPTLDQLNQFADGAVFPGSSFSPQPSPPIPPGGTVIVLVGGNPDLEPERATTWTASVELTPRWIEGLRLEASLFDVDYRDRVVDPLVGLFSVLVNPAYADLLTFAPSQAQVLDIAGSLPRGLQNVTGRPFDPASVAVVLDGRLRNTASERARGVDLAAEYQTDLGRAGRLLLTASGSYLDSNRRITAGLPLVQRAGRIFNPPHWRGRVGATWDGGRLGGSAFVNYVGSTLDERLAPTLRVEPFVTLDVSARLRLGGSLRRTELRLTALNLLAEKPAHIRNSEPSAVSYDSTNQSPIGRFIGLSLVKSW